MECVEIGTELRDWARGPGLPAEAREHVDRCATCAAEWKREKELTAALENLAAAWRGASASPAVKAAVLAALPAPPSRDWRPLLAIAAVLLAGILAGWYLLFGKPVNRTAAARPLYTDFFPLSAVALDRHEAAQLVRIRLPRREMRRFGLPVNEEFERASIEADVLIGQDGIARAVRFVSQSHGTR